MTTYRRTLLAGVGWLAICGASRAATTMDEALDQAKASGRPVLAIAMAPS